MEMEQSEAKKVRAQKIYHKDLTEKVKGRAFWWIREKNVQQNKKELKL